MSRESSSRTLPREFRAAAKSSVSAITLYPGRSPVPRESPPSAYMAAATIPAMRHSSRLCVRRLGIAAHVHGRGRQRPQRLQHFRTSRHDQRRVCRLEERAFSRLMLRFPCSCLSRPPPPPPPAPCAFFPFPSFFFSLPPLFSFPISPFPPLLVAAISTSIAICTAKSAAFLPPSRWHLCARSWDTPSASEALRRSPSRLLSN